MKPINQLRIAALPVLAIVGMTTFAQAPTTPPPMNSPYYPGSTNPGSVTTTVAATAGGSTAAAVVTPAVSVAGGAIKAVDGTVFPAGTPPEAVDRYNRALLAPQQAPTQLPSNMPQIAAAAPQGAPASKSSMPRIPVPGEGIDARDFANAFNTILPLSPKQIVEINSKAQQLERAKAYVEHQPQAVATPMRVSLAAGERPNVVRLATGMLSTIVFTDRTGAPWPVLQVQMGSKEFVAWEPMRGIRTNQVMVQANSPYASSNMVVFLEGANAPVMFSVVSGQRQVDTRVDAQVASDGPEAFKSNRPSDPSAGVMSDSNEIKELAHGINPSSLLPLTVSGRMSNHVQAWRDRSGSLVFLRTSMQILSPTPTQAGRGIDGSSVYAIPRAEVVTFMDRGNIYTVSLGFDGASDLASILQRR